MAMSSRTASAACRNAFWTSPLVSPKRSIVLSEGTQKPACDFSDGFAMPMQLAVGDVFAYFSC